MSSFDNLSPTEPAVKDAVEQRELLSVVQRLVGMIQNNELPPAVGELLVTADRIARTMTSNGQMTEPPSRASTTDSGCLSELVSPSAPETEYTRTNELRCIQAEINTLLERAAAIEQEARDHFGEVTLILGYDAQGNLTSVPTFPEAEDPVRAVFSHPDLGSEFHERENIVPRLEQLSVTAWRVVWSDSETNRSSELSSEALNYRDFGFGEEGRQDRWPNRELRPLYTLNIRYLSSENSGLNLGRLARTEEKNPDIGRSPFIVMPDCCVDPVWQPWANILDRMSQRAKQTLGLAKVVKEDWSYEGVRAYLASQSKHNPYSLLGMFQEAVVAVHEPKSRAGLLPFGRRNSTSRQNPTSGSDVGLNTEIEKFVNRSDVQEVFSGLKHLGKERQSVSGLNHELTDWLVGAVNELESALSSQMATISHNSLAVSNGTLGDAPEYFRQFCSEVSHLHSSRTSLPQNQWLNRAQHALSALERGLTTLNSTPLSKR